MREDDQAELDIKASNVIFDVTFLKMQYVKYKRRHLPRWNPFLAFDENSNVIK